MKWQNIIMVLLVFSCIYTVQGQEYRSPRLLSFPSKAFTVIDKKTSLVEEKLYSGTKKYFNKIQREERRLYKKLKRRDSATAEKLFGSSVEKYKQMADGLKDSSVKTTRFAHVYNPHMDSIRTALSFMEQQDKSDSTGQLKEKYKSTIAGLNHLQGKLDKTDAIGHYLGERKKYLQKELEQFGLIKELKKYRDEVAYYQLQIEEYKNILSNPAKVEEEILGILSKSQLFTDFFNKNSALASLFRLPGGGSSGTPIAGLQTRSLLQQDLQQRMGAGSNVSQIVQQNAKSAQTELNQIKEKLRLPDGGKDGKLPEFTPHSTRTKSFLQRLEVGTNFQNTRSSYFFPATTDIGLSIGYKLNDKSVVGLGSSGKIGWGKDIRNIILSEQGASLRSFLDIKLKGNFFASGGFEYNYQQPIDDSQYKYNPDSWTKSGLVGISKTISLQSKLFKKTKLQLFWDFLSYQQIPRTQPVKFRINYMWSK